MKADITIPPEAPEAVARKLAMLCEDGTENWQDYLFDANDLCFAMLRAWETDTHRMIVGTALDEVGGTYPAIILPLPKEASDE